MTAIDPTARPIRFTADIPAWQRILESLGGALISEHPGWLVYQLGSGKVALHAASNEQPAGTSVLALETSTDLGEAAVAARDRAVPIEVGMTGHGTAGIVDAADGTTFTLDVPTENPTGAAASEPRLSVLQIWYGPDTSGPRSTMEGLGARPRFIGNDGTWTDLTCPGGGLVAVHAAAEVGAELAFEWDGDVEDAHALLQQADIRAALIDESYSRTLHIADPDGVKEIWLNEKQTDLYGYTDASAGA